MGTKLCRWMGHPFAGVAYVFALVAVAHAIETGDAAHAMTEFEPGAVALVGAAGVYAARTVYELVLQQRRDKRGDDDGGGGGVQRLLDLYTAHAHAEERILEQVAESVSAMRESLVRVGAQADTNAAAIAKLADSQASVLRGLDQLTAIVARCQTTIFREGGQK